MRDKGNRVLEVWTQEQLDDAASTHYPGLIVICGGSSEAPLRLSARTPRRPRAVGDSCVRVSNSAWIAAYDDAKISAVHRAHVIAHDTAFVRAWGRSNIELHDKARACVYDRTRMKAFGDSVAHLHGLSFAQARGNALVIVYGRAHARLHQCSRAHVAEDGKATLYSPHARVL